MATVREVREQPVEAPAYSSGDLAAAARLIASAREVTLLAHVNPDADALGSALALGLALHRRGVRVTVSFGAPRAAPESLQELDVAGLVVAADAVPAAPELLVVVDTGSLARLGPLADRVSTAGSVLVVDHHVSGPEFASHRYVDPTAEATAVLTLRLLDALGAPVDPAIARCLYAGLVTDTSSFRRATPGTHVTASRLLAAGVDAEETTRPLLDTHPFGWLGMLGSVLSSARLEPDEARGLGLVHARITTAESAGLRPEEIESVIDVLRTTAEAEVAAVLKQSGPGEWTVSLRAKNRMDVASAASALGGGGHRMAAGYTAHGELDEIVESLRAALADAPLL